MRRQALKRRYGHAMKLGTRVRYVGPDRPSAKLPYGLKGEIRSYAGPRGNMTVLIRWDNGIETVWDAGRNYEAIK
jgi:hypothetical protein